MHPSFISRLLAATVVVAACIFPGSAFMYGSDYDAYKTSNLYNCTGSSHVSNVTIPNAFDTLPQVAPRSEMGWEQWTLFLHGTFPMILRWNHGDPSSNASSPDLFDLLILGVDNVQISVGGELSYTNAKNIKRIAIGENSLTWDSHSLWYNASISIDGYIMSLDSFSATLDAFHPNVAFHNGLLDQPGGWFGSVPVIRGQVVGSLSTPTQQNITLDGLSAMRHMFSEKPLPAYINKYTAGTAWGYSTAFYDTYVFYHTEASNGTVHDAAFLGRALPIPNQRGGFSSAWATYAFTDDPSVYTLNIDSATNEINATFRGCSNTDNIPYVFNISAPTLLGEFSDSGGGVTSYYSVDGSTTAPWNGSVTEGMLAGIYEEYQAPSTNS